MNLKCHKCGSAELIKNGLVFGQQRYKCKQCNYQFTKVTPAGKPLFHKIIAHSLYVSGLSMRETAHIIGVTVQSVSRWIKKWHPAYMSEIGNHSLIGHIQKAALMKQLNIDEASELIVLSTDLPSGAKYHAVIEIPERDKSFKK